MDDGTAARARTHVTDIGSARLQRRVVTAHASHLSLALMVLTLRPSPSPGPCGGGRSLDAVKTRKQNPQVTNGTEPEQDGTKPQVNRHYAWSSRGSNRLSSTNHKLDDPHDVAVQERWAGPKSLIVLSGWLVQTDGRRPRLLGGRRSPLRTGG